MIKLYAFITTIFCLCLFNSNELHAQDCALLKASFQTNESRCAATGSIKVNVSGGSGSYKYKTIGPVNSNFTTTDSITGLSAGTYTVVINDIVSNCVITKTGIIVSGSYEDPRFTLKNIDVSCDNGQNGSITVNNLQNGRSPFTFSIAAPSPMGIGTTNSTGIFKNLVAGDYSIRLTDSCGGIQTRTVTVNNYTWKIDSNDFTKFSCDSAKGSLKVVDSRGNISTFEGIPGFSYGAITHPGDTTWSSNANFALSVNGVKSIDVFAKDSCGTAKKVSLSLFLTPAVNATVSTSAKTCSTFTAAVKGITNFFNPEFCLYDAAHNKIACNGTGTFTNLQYGNYCIKAHDGCTDTTISRCFSEKPPLITVDNAVTITNLKCGGFDAAITGQVGLTTPSYCLYTSKFVLVSCNTTGKFVNVPYGDYCILIVEPCRNTNISRCFSVSRPIPAVAPNISPSYVNCVNFGIVTGGQNFTSPTYCLTDTNGVVIACNSTGIFDSIPLGSYCVSIKDACLDTTIRRCFTVGLPKIYNDLVVDNINKTCSTFTAKANTLNIKNANYCLYDASNLLIACNSTGVFDMLAYGNYCVKVKNACPDTTIVTCFSAAAPSPSVSSSVIISNKRCTTFSAQITGQQNLTNPQYCIENSKGDVLGCNTSGNFTNLPYGSYCIKIKNTCYDTTIDVCFDNFSIPIKLTATASKSCYYGFSKFNMSITGASSALIQIYNSGNSLIKSGNYMGSNFTIDSLPGLAAGAAYTIIATDSCENKDTVQLAPVIGFLTHLPTVLAKCPGSLWINGSGNVMTDVTSNMGAISVRIIQKDDTPLSPQLVPTSVSGNTYYFNDLGPATYILTYKISDGCNVVTNDTTIVAPYQYPNLSRASAYQCDKNGFSVGAVASNGVGPFSYSIIGSTPALPSILAGPQTDPVFNIDNNVSYTLIRLRALDACGNATLADASILPLANNGIVVSLNCFLHPSTLSVDPIYNSTYSWYRKASMASTDSTLISAGYNYFIPNVLPTDTGLYVCHIIVNNGCIRRTHYFNLTGDCSSILPIALMNLTGDFINRHVLLNWEIDHGDNLKEIIIERKNANNDFLEIGKSDPLKGFGIQTYKFEDTEPGEQNFYRIRLVDKDGSSKYSNIVFVKQKINSIISIYPNPVEHMVKIDFHNVNNHVYRITLLNTLNQTLKQIDFRSGVNNSIQIRRTKNMVAGFYIIRILDVNTNQEFSEKLIFKP